MRAILVCLFTLSVAVSALAQERSVFVPIRVEDGIAPRTYWLDPAWQIEFSQKPPATGESKSAGVPRELAPDVWLVPVSGKTKSPGHLEKGSPAFRSSNRPGASLMALPGGIVVVFESSWSADAARAWLGERGLEIAREFELSKPTFEVASEAGMAAIELARELLSEPPVQVATPNWWQEVATH